MFGCEFMSRSSEKNGLSRVGRIADPPSLDKLRCVTCDSTELVMEGANEVVCSECGSLMPVERGVLVPDPSTAFDSGTWDNVYSSAPGMDRSILVKLLRKGFDDPRLLSAYYPLVRLVRKLEAPLESSVELGAGSGLYSLILKKLGLVKEVYLLDYSTEAMERAFQLFNEFNEECTLVLSKLESAPFRRKSFDLAFSGGVIEHYPTSEEQAACLEAHLSIAKYTYIQAPSHAPCYWTQRALITVLKRGWPFGFERPVRTKELLKLVEDKDANVIAEDYQYFLQFVTYLIPALAGSPRIADRGWGIKSLRTDIAFLIE